MLPVSDPVFGSKVGRLISVLLGSVEILTEMPGEGESLDPNVPSP